MVCETKMPIYSNVLYGTRKKAVRVYRCTARKQLRSQRVYTPRTYVCSVLLICVYEWLLVLTLHRYTQTETQDTALTHRKKAHNYKYLTRSGETLRTAQAEHGSRYRACRVPFSELRARARPPRCAARPFLLRH
jgi:hypothetical protein